MKYLIIVLSILLSYSYSKKVVNAKSAKIVIEDFSSSELGKFPEFWKTREKLGKNLYVVNQEGEYKYLTVTDRGESIQIGKEFSWDIEQYPILSWSWRVKELPKGAAENDSKSNDSAAGLYVVFDSAWFFIPRTLKFVWSSTLPVGTIITKGYTKIIILQSGKEKANQWVSEKINIYEEYERHFGKKPPNPRGIALLTDANDTKSIAVADYRGFYAKSENPNRIVAGENK